MRKAFAEALNELMDMYSDEDPTVLISALDAHLETLLAKQEEPE